MVLCRYNPLQMLPSLECEVASIDVDNCADKIFLERCLGHREVQGSEVLGSAFHEVDERCHIMTVITQVE